MCLGKSWVNEFLIAKNGVDHMDYMIDPLEKNAEYRHSKV